GRTLTDMHGNGILPASFVTAAAIGNTLSALLSRLPRLLATRRQTPIVPPHLLGETLQLVIAGNVEQRYDPAPIRVAATFARRRRWCDRTESISAGDEQLVARRIQRHSGRIPAGWNQAANGVIRRTVDVDNGNGVVCRIRNIDCFPGGTYRHRVWRASENWR